MTPQLHPGFPEIPVTPPKFPNPISLLEPDPELAVKFPETKYPERLLRV